ncbi:LOW QUALITY PROTEIN: mas-related G-protein coupled receptor member X1-like [Sarcophilus harrisii]
MGIIVTTVSQDDYWRAAPGSESPSSIFPAARARLLSRLGNSGDISSSDIPILPFLMAACDQRSLTLLLEWTAHVSFGFLLGAVAAALHMSASEEPGFLGMSDTTEELDYVHDNTTERSANECFLRRNETLGKLYLHYGMRVPSLLVALLGLLGNGAVLWLLGFRSPRTPFSVYILNLAGADALFLCCSLLIFIERLVRYIDIPLIFNIIMWLRYISYTAGLSLLAAISTERCLSRPEHTSASVCAVLWALPSLLRIARFIVCVFMCIRHFCPNFIYIQIAWFVLLTCVLCVSSLTLLLRVQCSSRRRRRPPRLCLLVLLTVLVFLLCGLPMGIQYLLKRLFKIPWSHWLLYLLACVSSSANPIIYFALGSQRRKKREPLRVVLQRALGEERGGRMRATPHANNLETSF